MKKFELLVASASGVKSPPRICKYFPIIFYAAIFLDTEPISGKYCMVYLFLITVHVAGDVIIMWEQGWFTWQQCMAHAVQYSAYCTPHYIQLR